MSTLTLAQKVAAYIQLRDYKKSAEDEFKNSMSRVDAAKEKLEAELLADLNEAGANSLACDAGTVYVTTQTNATVENREAFLNFIKETDLWEAMDVKANKTFAKEYMDEKGEVLPGLKITQFAKVGVRRS